MKLKFGDLEGKAREISRVRELRTRQGKVRTIEKELRGIVPGPATEGSVKARLGYYYRHRGMRFGLDILNEAKQASAK